MDKKWPFRTALAVGIAALAVGASFHGLRMHPENAAAYELGVTMGMTMASVAAAAFIAAAALYARYRKLKNKRRSEKR